MNRKKSSHRKRNIIITLLCVVLALYLILVNVLVSAALVPSFMRRLEAFDTLTEEGYSQQAHTTQIQKNHAAAARRGEKFGKNSNLKKLSITSEDGFRLVAAYVPAGSDKKTAAVEMTKAGRKNASDEKTVSEKGSADSGHRYVILLHGYTGWKEEMYPYAAWYHAGGWNVLIPDLRCQGESEGDFIGMGWTDRKDVMDWIRLLIKKDPDAEIVLHGVSMGAACALMVSGMEDLPENVKAVISDSAYTDAYSMFRKQCRDWFHLPAFPLVDSAGLMLQIRGGYSLRKASALDAVKRSRTPTLFIHGDKDKFVPVSDVYTLYQSAVCQKQLYVCRGAGHTQAVDVNPQKYWQKIRQFLRAND